MNENEYIWVYFPKSQVNTYMFLRYNSMGKMFAFSTLWSIISKLFQSNDWNCQMHIKPELHTECYLMYRCVCRCYMLKFPLWNLYIREGYEHTRSKTSIREFFSIVTIPQSFHASDKK